MSCASLSGLATVTQLLAFARLRMRIPQGTSIQLIYVFPRKTLGSVQDLESAPSSVPRYHVQIAIANIT